MENNEIQAWLDANVKDYAAGVELLARYGTPGMARSFRAGSPRFLLPQLTAILRRLSLKKSIPSTKSIPSIQSTPSQPPSAPLPEPITIAKSRLHELWLHLVTFHQKLLALGTANDDITKAKRIALMNERQPYIDAFSQLYLLKEEYFALPEGKRTIPPALVSLLATLDGKPDPTPSIPSINPITSTPPSQKNDLSNLDPLERHNLRRAILEKIRRRQNKLKYQQDTPGTLNPMPDGPRRKKIESQLASLQSRLEEINSLSPH